MAENNETQLRGEIQRLNSIIDIILNENRQLKQLLWNNGLEADKVNHLFYSYAQEEDIPNENIYAIPSETNEAKQTFYSHVSKEHIPQQSFCLINEKSIGVNNVFCAGASNGDTTKQVFCHTASQSIGVKQNNLAVASVDDARNEKNTRYATDKHSTNSVLCNTSTNNDNKNNSKTTQGENGDKANKIGSPTAAPADAPKYIYFDDLFNELQLINRTCSESGLWNTANILVTLRSTPKQSLKDLQKLTGLSEDGIVKRIMAMKKQGLIVRLPGRRLAITAKAETLIQKSMR